VLALAGCELVSGEPPQPPFDTGLGVTFVPQPAPPGGVDLGRALAEIRRQAPTLIRPPDVAYFGTCAAGPECPSGSQQPLLFIEWAERDGWVSNGKFLVDATTGQVIAGGWSE
jgi:hypothetical protein